MNQTNIELIKQIKGKGVGHYRGKDWKKTDLVWNELINRFTIVVNKVDSAFSTLEHTRKCKCGYPCGKYGYKCPHGITKNIVHHINGLAIVENKKAGELQVFDMLEWLNLNTGEWFTRVKQGQPESATSKKIFKKPEPLSVWNPTLEIWQNVYFDERSLRWKCWETNRFIKI